MTDTIRKFRTGYVAAFGAADPEDMLYEAVSEGRRYPGMEHWLPLFHDKLDTLFDYVPGAPVVLEKHAEDAARERLSQIKDYYEARKEALADTSGNALQAAAAGPALSAGSRMGRAAEDRGAGAADAVCGAGGGRRDGRCRRARRPQFFVGAGGQCRRRVRCGEQARPVAAGCGQARRHRAVERGRPRAHEARAGRARPAQPVAGQAHGRRRWRCRSRRSRSRCWASKAASRPRTSPSSASRTFWATGWCGRAARRSARTISSPR